MKKLKKNMMKAKKEKSEIDVINSRFIGIKDNINTFINDFLKEAYKVFSTCYVELENKNSKKAKLYIELNCELRKIMKSVKGKSISEVRDLLIEYDFKYTDKFHGYMSELLKVLISLIDIKTYRMDSFLLNNQITIRYNEAKLYYELDNIRANIAKLFFKFFVPKDELEGMFIAYIAESGECDEHDIDVINFLLAEETYLCDEEGWY